MATVARLYLTKKVCLLDCLKMLIILFIGLGTRKIVKCMH